MKLKQVRIRDFKRFSDLTISQIPLTVKLVILTGPNGSGKTSLFEAFNYWMNFQRGQNSFESEYYSRISINGQQDAHSLLQKIELQFGNSDENKTDLDQKRKAFYIRSAYRHEPDFTAQGFGATDDILNDSRRATRLIHQEQRVSENYQRMVADAVMALYSDDPLTQQRSIRDVADELIGETRQAMLQVFDNLELQGPGNPITGGTFRFKKGTASGFHYKNLSGGEKAAFDLLLDFIVKRRAFDNTVFCIDEPELHMHTRLQAKLLEVMFSLVPDNCQLWLSTHSIGMARTAAHLYSRNPGEVAFIDFHQQDFDNPTTLIPIVPNRNFWQQMFHTALDDLAQLVVPQCVVFCEGRKVGISGKKPSFDAKVYQIIFDTHYPQVEFVPLGGNNEVEHDGKAFDFLLTKLAPGIKTWKVFDKDDRSIEEIAALRQEGGYVLGRRDIESYLWDDEVLAALCEKYGRPDVTSILIQEKKNQINSLPSRGKPIDDVKAIADSLYIKCKSELGLTQCGNTAEAFAIDQLAPLIQPSMNIYQELVDVVLAPIRSLAK
jgi:predicted ATPase